MVICVLFTLLSLVLGSESLENATLTYGKALSPIQWFLSPFIHGDMIQMLGNVVFLALFGSMIEGRLGSPLFLILFLLLAIGGSAMEQTISLALPTGGVTEGSTTSTSWPVTVGMSTTLFGLIAVFLLIDAKTNLQLGSDPPMEIPLIAFVGLFVIWEIAKWLISGSATSNVLFHSTGLILGLTLGGFIRVTGLAEIEGSEEPVVEREEPLIDPLDMPDGLDPPKETRSQRRARLKIERRARKQAAREQAELVRQSGLATPKSVARPRIVDPVVRQAQEAISENRAIDALRLINEITEEKALKQLPLEDFVKLYNAMVENKKWHIAAMLLEKSLTGHPDDDIERRLSLVQIHLALKETENCQSVLAKIDRESLDNEQKKLYRRLVSELRQLGSLG